MGGSSTLASLLCFEVMNMPKLGMSSSSHRVKKKQIPEQIWSMKVNCKRLVQKRNETLTFHIGNIKEPVYGAQGSNHSFKRLQISFLKAICMSPESTLAF